MCLNILWFILYHPIWLDTKLYNHGIVGYSNDEPKAVISPISDIAWHYVSGLILGLHPANERCRYFVMASLIAWAQV